MLLRRPIRALLLMLSILLVVNCGKDEPSRPGATELPTIGVITPAAWQVVAGSVTVQVEAFFADRVALFADDQPVAEAPTPYHLTWDTRNILNGRHRLRLVATNGRGDVDSTLDVVTENPGQGVAVVAPLTVVHLRPGASSQITVIVVGAENRDVDWLVESGGAEAGLRGSVDSQGLYTAPRHPPDPPTVTVIARSVADPTRFAEVIVHLDGVTVQISPESIDVPIGRTRQFAAHVFGTSDQAVAWSVVEGESRGDINESGLYVAPATLPNPPVATIRAISHAGPAASTTATIRLAGPVTVVIFPSVVHVPAGGTIQLRGTAENAPDDGVDWWVEGGSDFGSITPTGLYTAPATLPDPPQARVWARSQFDTLSRASAGISLVAPPPELELFAALELMTRSGHRAAMISDQAMNLVITGLTRAFHLNGQHLTTVGTLRRLGYDYYVYEPPAPGDRRLILMGEGPQVEVTIDSLQAAWLPYPFNGVMGGCDFKGYLACRLHVDGLVDLEIVASGVEDAQGFGGVDFNRTLSGEVDTGTIWSLDLHDSGNYDESFHFGAIEHRLVGMVTVGGVPLSLDERFMISYVSNCHSSGESTLYQEWHVNTRAGIGSAAWSVSGDINRYVDSRCGFYELVLSPASWVATGLVTMDGTDIGQFRWTGPVTLGMTPPRAVIDVPGRDPFEPVIPRSPEVLIENTVQD
ncbi:MAG: Ig-like domain-containing protein [Candidatus Eisenbacteria bacterium]|nr:Ig-like domain-containing protein [Candidatus Eisenbacteria bacterium]